MSTVILEKVLRDRGIKYKQHHLGVLVAEAAENDGLPADIIFSDMINGLLLVSANLPFEIEPARTEVMTAAACTLNAASEFGCFYISPGRQIMEFRGYTPAAPTAATTYASRPPSISSEKRWARCPQ